MKELDSTSINCRFYYSSTRDFKFLNFLSRTFLDTIANTFITYLDENKQFLGPPPFV